jgi:hypothetical protein
MAQTTIDSYSQVYRDSQYNLNDSIWGVAQSFLGSGITLSDVKFYLKKYGSPTGTITAALYAHTGTYGTSSKPTGSALITSATVNASSLSTVTWQLVTFTFALPYPLAASTYYCIAVLYSSGEELKTVQVGYDRTSLLHSGNLSSMTSSSAWVASSGYDVCFYCYSNQIANAFIL